MTRLAASVWVARGEGAVEWAVAEAARAAEAGADLVEYRLDELVGDEGVEEGVRGEGGVSEAVRLVEASPLPCIATCRPVWEGGRYEGEESARRALFEALAAATRPPVYLDVELRAYQNDPAWRELIEQVAARAEASGGGGSPGIILSSHDFEGRPADLLRRVAAMAGVDAARVVKLAWSARSLRDNLEAFELLGPGQTQGEAGGEARGEVAVGGKPMIALCMGEFGVASRVLAKKFGGLLTFAALDAQRKTAPGQPTLDEFKRLYRWDAIRRDTPVFGVIGYPVGHSMSPAVHNAALEASRADGVYLPMPIAPGWEPFKATLATWLDFGPLNFRGASVTIPHKEHLLRFVRESGGEIEPLAERIGAANTLAVRADGTLYACNTDYAAALDAVCEALSIERDDLAGRRVGVLGAGGAARAVVAGFAHHGARVTVYNRTLERARDLAEALGDASPVGAASLDAVSGAEATIWVNCTPVGMHPNVDATPMVVPPGDRAWGPGVLAFDTIYNPVQTRWLTRARAAGCVTVSGVEMFVRQAAAQFELWTGRAAPVDVMRRVVEERLGEAS